jgi:IS30 family transposase
MSRRGRLRTGLDLCLDHVEEIAKLDAAGYGTAEIQAKLSTRRSTISRVRAILRAAEERGRESAVRDAAESEPGAEPFPKYAEAGAP